jgi:hypothetical protein
MATDTEVNFHVLYARTVQELDMFRARVAENRDVDQAVAFARFILNSRLAQVLEPQSRNDYLKVDGAFLRWKAEELERLCTERYRTNDQQPRLEALQLESLHERQEALHGKVDVLAGLINRLLGDAGASLSSSCMPALPGSGELKVISGDLDGAVRDAGVEEKQRNGRLEAA